MSSPKFHVEPDVRRAEGPPLELYFDARWFEALRDRVFARAWLGVDDVGSLAEPGFVRPHVLLEGCLDEPLLLARARDGALRCLSNACTHRGNLVVQREERVQNLVCSYHGRRFELDGRCRSMPEFRGVEGFPSPADDLRPVPLGLLGTLAFASLAPPATFEEWLAPVLARVGFLPLDRLALDPPASRDFEFDANWALYCDNYLEGFHIPFLHEALNEKLDFAKYRTELFDLASVQVGPAAEGEIAFDLPKGHVDFGERVAGYYFWLWPTTMLNVYPWGISVNLVRPISPTRTRVRFLAYVLDASKRALGAGTGLDRVEMEDEAAVMAVQRGVRSRFARRARYSPTQETGVHHFHRLLARALEV